MRIAIPLVLVLLLPALAGCATPGALDKKVKLEDSGVETRAPTTDEYWMIWAHGSELRKAPPGKEVSRGAASAFDHTLYATDKRVAYRAAPGADPTTTSTFLAVDFTDETSGNGIVYAHAVNGGLKRIFGEAGAIAIEPRADGTLVIDGMEVPVGKKWHATWTKREEGVQWKGDLVIENLGAWPKSGLTPRSF